MNKNYKPANAFYEDEWIDFEGESDDLEFDGPVVILDCYEGAPEAKDLNAGYLLGPDIGEASDDETEEGVTFIVAPTRSSRGTVIHVLNTQTEFRIVDDMEDEEDDDF